MLDTLTQTQVDQLVIRLSEGQETFTYDDAAKLLEWASEVVLDQTLLEMVMDGKVKVSVKGGKVCFQHKRKAPRLRGAGG